MDPIAPSTGVPYLPDGHCALPPEPRQPHPWTRALAFVLCYATLQALYVACAGTAVERFFLEDLGSRPVASLIGHALPDLGAHAVGPRVTAPGGGINISNGCEGIDIYVLLAAAFAVAPLAWRHRILGLALGLCLAFALNQARIATLFFAYRSNQAWFDRLHTTVAPVILVVVIALYFHAWLRHCRRPAQIAP